jgi:acyl-CoA reductase-like NAD-dependent aldehyde dehydrogenase
MLHLPLLRAGRGYRSLDVSELRDVRTGRVVARVSQAHPGLIGRDLSGAAERRALLRRVPARELLEICRRAARMFVEEALPVDPLDGVMQSPEDYVAQLSATTGLPLALARANMAKVQRVLDEMETVLAGLTRGLALSVLDTGYGAAAGGRTVSCTPVSDALGVVLPSNSPGVHTLWLPAIPLKTPLALKPGAREPWTPMRVIQALVRAGCPAEAFGLYPTDYAGATEILLRAGRAMVFGDVSTVRPFAGDPRVQIHGPGWSKVLLGADQAGDWPRHLDLLVESIADNGGRSCLNASSVWLPAHGRELAEALAERLARIEPLPLDDPQARIAAFPDPAAARRISELIDRHLRVPGAEDLTARRRAGGRLVERGGCTFLRPTLVLCEAGHPLAACEFLFPFAAVVEVPQRELVSRIGPTLVATALTEDGRLIDELMDAPHVDRLNVGPVPTCRVAWDQPHEGNLFEHLYRHRALQRAQ